jgi:polyvinyl alcohol dehydrogenase (cytochrome)
MGCRASLCAHRLASVALAPVRVRAACRAAAVIQVWALVALGVATTPALGASSWPLAGRNLANSRAQPNETLLTTANVGTLTPKWELATHGFVSATPTVSQGVVYFPDSGGYLYAVSAASGALIWQQQISAYTGVTAARSRVSPAIYGSELILGDNGSKGSGAHVFAVSRSTGKLLWKTQVDSHPAAIITGSPVVAGGKVIVGISSSEEGLAESATYACCTFRGSVVALNAKSGAPLWKTYTVPPNSGPCTSSNPAAGCGYSGGAIWSPPAVDTVAHSIYVGTGNNYTAPYEANRCEQEAIEHERSDAGCTAPDDYFDSVIALELETGAIKWGHKLRGWDAYNLACKTQGLGGTWCPSIQSPDFDFGGGGPNLLTVGGHKVVGIGQKSGVYWALDPSTGNVVWSKLVGPGTAEGGIQWGTAYDGKRIYVPIADPPPFSVPYVLANGESDAGGSWAALNPATGAFDWQVATPADAPAMGPPSETHGIVFVGDMSSSGPNIFALEAATGRQLWSFAAEGDVNSAPAIVEGVVYWGSGYGAATSHTFYALSSGGAASGARRRGSTRRARR